MIAMLLSALKNLYVAVCMCACVCEPIIVSLLRINSVSLKDIVMLSDTEFSSLYNPTLVYVCLSV